MLIPYSVFYRRQGVRFITQFKNPPTSIYSNVVLPQDSLYHFDTVDPGVLGPAGKGHLLSGLNVRVPIDFIDTLVTDTDVRKRKVLSIKSLIQKYIKDNVKDFVYKPDLAITPNNEKVMVLSYSLLEDLYDYKRMPMTYYHYWENRSNTIFENINAQATLNPAKQNFIVIDAPNVIPALSFFLKYQSENKLSMLKVFNDIKDFNLLNIWRWINPETRELSTINRIVKDNYGKVDIIFKYNDVSYTINLGTLDSFNNKTIAEESKSVTIAPFTLQKLFLKTIMYLHETNDLMMGEDAPNIEEQEQPTDTPTETDDDLRLDKDESQTEVDSQYEETVNPDQIVKSKQDLTKIKDESVDKEAFRSDSFLEDLDKDIEELDKYYKVMNEGEELAEVEEEAEAVEFDPNKLFTRSEDEVTKIIENISTPVSPEQKALSVVEHYKNSKLLNSAEYKKAITLLNEFPKSKNPYTNESIEKYSTITNEEIKITNESKKLVDTTVSTLQPSMAENSTQVFDKEYIGKYMNKDKVSVVRSLQNAGILINSYEVEKVTGAMGEYEIHTLKVKPILGGSSTIRFKLPVVNEDGEYTSNGKTYTTRKQRGDVPIRKINAHMVGLTSYYGKTFVERDQRVSNNSILWLTSHISKLAFSHIDSSVKAIVPSNVYYKDLKVPFMYGTLATSFLSIKLDNVYLFFDYKQRDTLFDEKVTKDVESDGMILCGYTLKDKKPILIDFNNDFYMRSDGKNVLLGDFYGLSGIDRSKEPVDFCNLRVFSVNVPIVVCLSSHMGFFNLFSYLGTKYRLIESNKRSNLEPFEYEIKFKDYKIILDKRDRKSLLVFGGLSKFDKLNKEITLEQLKSKEIWFDYFVDMKLNSIYFKELGLYYDMFIDPITKDILLDMKEPTTFLGLLFRSVELLLDDRHPASTDMRFMRIKGYERMSGAVYKELVTAVRELRVKSVIGKSQLNMSPFAVWKAVNTDEAGILVADINPIEYLKQRDSVTFTGAGGRSKDSIMGRDRIFGENEIGVIGEATSDSSDVGINTFLTANPGLTNLRGLTEAVKPANANPTDIITVTAMASAGSTHDDPKRVN